MGKPIDISAKDFQKEVLESDIPVLVDFWASWCMPCRMMSPVLEKMAEDFEGKLKVIKINTETSENMPLAMLYVIRSIPNMKLFKGGKVSRDFIGFRPEEIFKEELEDLL